MKKVLVIYYSQTGQLKELAEHCVKPLLNAENIQVDYLNIQTREKFPFPWTAQEFFGVFPETVYNTPFELEPLENTATDYDLIVLAYTVWYMNPSIPINSFLKSAHAKKLFDGKKVVTLIGARNMWVLCQQKVKGFLKDLNARLIGNIALVDRAKNLTSIVTVIRWMFYGKKDAFLFFPPAGIAQQDIINSQRFGNSILSYLEEKTREEDLQKELNALGATEIQPNLLVLEKRATKLFKKYADFIAKKGGYKDPARKTRVKMLSYSIPVGAFVLSPITTIMTYLVSLIKRKEIEKEIAYHKQNKL
ncbi:MAG: hypothetical protein WD048_00230 [Chitinophagales bacterium]